MNPLNIGQIITTPQQRDAIHVAVVPVIAGQMLYPGEHVGLIKGEAWSTLKDKKPGLVSIGIVDPFLKANVAPKESFWLFLYPGTVTDLRHAWTHPAFQPLNPMYEASIGIVKTLTARLEFDYEKFMAAAHRYLENGESEATFDHGWTEPDWMDDEWPNFWYHFEVITGKKPKNSREGFTGCCV